MKQSSLESKEQQISKLLSQTFDFDKILKCKETRHIFKQYLESEYNVEPLEFVEQLESYHQEVVNYFSQFTDFSLQQQQQEMDKQSLETTNSSGNSPPNSQPTMKPLSKSKSAGNLLSTPNPTTQFNSSLQNQKSVSKNKFMKLFSPSEDNDPLHISSIAASKQLSQLHISRQAALAELMEEGSDATKPMIPKYRILAQKIMDTFIKQGSTKQLNLSSEDVRKLLERMKFIEEFQVAQNYQDWLYKKQVTYELFSKVEERIQFQLSNDTFPRFVRSDIWKQFLISKQLDFFTPLLREKGHSITYTLEEMNEAVIKHRDFDFAEEWNQDAPHWKLHYTSEDHLTCLYRTSKNFLNETSGTSIPSIFKNMAIGKLVYYVPFNFEQVFKVRHSQYVTEPFISNCKQMSRFKVDREHGIPYAAVTLLYEAKLGLIFQNREFGMICSARKFEARGNIPERIIVISKPFDDNAIPKNSPKNERTKVMFIHTYFKVSHQMTRVVHITFINLGGALVSSTRFIIDPVSSKRNKLERQKIYDALLKYEKDGKPPLESFGLHEVYAENNTEYFSKTRKKTQIKVQRVRTRANKELAKQILEDFHLPNQQQSAKNRNMSIKRSSLQENRTFVVGRQSSLLQKALVSIGEDEEVNKRYTLFAVEALKDADLNALASSWREEDHNSFSLYTQNEVERDQNEGQKVETQNDTTIETVNTPLQFESG